jgi:tRNA-2-methylthio-N6-dimethylallyladenosine synthase
MRRGYDSEGYRRKIEGLRRRIPELAFGTDVIVGFPAESERDFEQTLALLDEVEFDTVYSFTYSPRPGTVAAEGPDEVPLPVKLERLQRLHARQRSIQEGRMQRWVGREVEVLVEGPSDRNPQRWSGRTAENRVVTFRGPAPAGTLQRIRISGASPFALRGSCVQSQA